MVFECGLLTLEHGMPYDVSLKIDVDDDEQEGTAFPASIIGCCARVLTPVIRFPAVGHWTGDD